MVSLVSDQVNRRLHHLLTAPKRLDTPQPQYVHREEAQEQTNTEYWIRSYEKKTEKNDTI